MRPPVPIVLLQKVKNPAASSGAFRTERLLEQTELLSCDFFTLMILEIATNNLRRDLVTDSANKIAIFPEFPAPKSSLEARKLAKNGPSTQTFEPSNNLSDGVSRRKRAKKMNMIGTNFHLVDHNVILKGNIGKKLFHASLYI